MRRRVSRGRSETVTVRLTPRTRYMAELAGRKQRRTLSNFVECAVAGMVATVRLRDGGPTLAEEAAELWDVDERGRFVKLATLHPELLTYEEQVTWRAMNTGAGATPN